MPAGEAETEAWIPRESRLLEPREQALLPRDGAGEEALVLGRVEATLGLQRRVVLHPVGRRVPCVFTDLVIADGDRPALVLLLQEDVEDELVEHGVLDLLDLVARESPTGALLLRLDLLLRLREPVLIQDVAAVHGGDRRGRGELGPAEQA